MCAAEERLSTPGLHFIDFCVCVLCLKMAFGINFGTGAEKHELQLEFEIQTQNCLRKGTENLARSNDLCFE